ncbi:LLM class F420-dependent oxidoreductase [Sphaerisporangium fuscum]|uniref:LLM class F420-dependent oxidoreductase n=1 Tax=Sphaerisporangium fuscum TaxID=2835868 RepID=UPI001BDCB89A|nr:LLM class F420-dependent oxidoreductase [Sphaerisporangium fuscum]
MRLGLALGYRAEQMKQILPLVEFAERIGVDSVWSAEEYGADAVTVLAYLAARTRRVQLGTGVMQLAARTPAATAMTAMTLDHLSEGRLLLGLGVSAPAIVEGWHGVPYGRPVARVREYVEILRKVIAGEEAVRHEGEHYRLPYRGPGGTGLAGPLTSSLTPIRGRIPTYLAAVGPRSVRLAGEIADGWMPGFYSPEREAVITAPLDEGIRRAGRETRDVEIAVIIPVVRADDLYQARDRLRPLYASYIGPVTPGRPNTYFELTCEIGFEREAERIRGHHLAGRRADAVAAVPDALLDEVALLGPLARIIDRLAAWKESRVGTLVLMTRDRKLLEIARAELA